jgi:excinuclease ABC subunit C
MIQKLWPIRKCKKSLPKEIGKERPCLNYHIGQCCAPCNNKITQQDYNKMINRAIYKWKTRNYYKENRKRNV